MRSLFIFRCMDSARPDSGGDAQEAFPIKRYLDSARPQSERHAQAAIPVRNDWIMLHQNQSEMPQDAIVF